MQQQSKRGETPGGEVLSPSQQRPDEPGILRPEPLPQVRNPYVYSPAADIGTVHRKIWAARHGAFSYESRSARSPISLFQPLNLPARCPRAYNRSGFAAKLSESWFGLSSVEQRFRPGCSVPRGKKRHLDAPSFPDIT